VRDNNERSALVEPCGIAAFGHQRGAHEAFITLREKFEKILIGGERN
jgi:hypothetical protein